jgi:hypothetical protein
VASCHSIRGKNIFINYILEYINVEVASCHHATVLGAINNNINYILEHINVDVASCHNLRGNKYFYKLYFRIY